MKRQKPVDPAFLAALTEAMNTGRVTIGDLAYGKKLPAGFWQHVASQIGSKPDAARMRFQRNREKWTTALEPSNIKDDKLIADENHDRVDTPEAGPSGAPSPDNDDTPITRRELTAALAGLESKLITLTPQISPALADPHGLPPRPAVRIPDRLRHVRAVMDKNLYAALETYAARFHGGNISAALTALVWRGLGKPKLSFEE